MRHPRIIIASISLAAVAAAGGIAAASVSGSPAPSVPATSPSPTAATVHAARAAVAGKTETILVNSHGLPLYYYPPDTAAKSLVTGGLARLWPPLASAGPAAAAGLSGRLTVVNDANGHQVAYNGHLLYTFTGDRAGQVTGQGVQNFFVATPGLAPIASSPAPTAPASSAPPSSGNGY